jgi:hypothetical protein
MREIRIKHLAEQRVSISQCAQKYEQGKAAGMACAAGMRYTVAVPGCFSSPAPLPKPEPIGGSSMSSSDSTTPNIKSKLVFVPDKEPAGWDGGKNVPLSELVEMPEAFERALVFYKERARAAKKDVDRLLAAAEEHRRRQPSR